MVSGTRCPYVGVCKDETVKEAAAPEEPMTYDSIQGNLWSEKPNLRSQRQNLMSERLNLRKGKPDFGSESLDFG